MGEELSFGAAPEWGTVVPLVPAEAGCISDGVLDFFFDRRGRFGFGRAVAASSRASLRSVAAIRFCASISARPWPIASTARSARAAPSAWISAWTAARS